MTTKPIGPVNTANRAQEGQSADEASDARGRAEKASDDALKEACPIQHGSLRMKLAADPAFFETKLSAPSALTSAIHKYACVNPQLCRAQMPIPCLTPDAALKSAIAPSSKSAMTSRLDEST